MTVLRALIADDEKPARAQIKRLLEAEPRIEVIGEAVHGVQAVDQIEALRPDLVFLDIQMPGLDGFEVLEAVGADRGFVVVFSTAHDEHALRAFDAHALDYLLKPYDAARFAVAVDKACRLVTAGTPRFVPPAPLGRLVVRAESGWVAIEQRDVFRVSADGKHVVVATATGQLRVRQTLAAVAKKLDAACFARVHRSEVVRVESVVRFEPCAHGDAVLTLRDGSAVPLSRTHRAAFLSRFGSPAGLRRR